MQALLSHQISGRWKQNIGTQIAMAHLPRHVVNFGTGQMSPDTSFVEVANTTADEWLSESCRSGSISSVVWGIWTYPRTHRWSFDRTPQSPRGGGSLLSSNAAGTADRLPTKCGRLLRHFQIQRMLYEHSGCSTWRDGTNSVS